MLLRLRSDPGPPSAPAPDDIFRVTGSRVILVVGHATSSDRTRKKWRAFVASSIGEASSCCRCRRSLSVWVCLSLHWVRSYREVFLAFIKSVLAEFLVNKDPVYIQRYSPKHNVCLLELENKGGQCIPWLIKDLFSILKLTSVTLKLFLRPRKTKKKTSAILLLFLLKAKLCLGSYSMSF